MRLIIANGELFLLNRLGNDNFQSQENTTELTIAKVYRFPFMYLGDRSCILNLY